MTTDLIALEERSPATVFSDGAEVDRLIADIRARVREHEPDVSTAKGRSQIASLAHRVSRSKTFLDEAGKKLNADKRKEIDAVDAHRRKIRTELDALKAEARRPLDEWEEAEEKRKQARINLLESLKVPFDVSAAADSAGLAAMIADIEAVEIDDWWQEYREEAERTKAATLETLRRDLAAQREREERDAELARLRAEQEERERKEREAREAEERARLEAERVKREAEEAERREREAKEREERARQEAVEAERRRAAEAEAERKRAEVARVADVENRRRKNAEARDALVQHAGIDAETAQTVIVAIFNGDIPNVSITY